MIILKKRNIKINVRPFAKTSIYEIGFTQTDNQPVIIGGLIIFYNI